MTGGGAHKSQYYPINLDLNQSSHSNMNLANQMRRNDLFVFQRRRELRGPVQVQRPHLPRRGGSLDPPCHLPGDRHCHRHCRHHHPHHHQHFCIMLYGNS